MRRPSRRVLTRLALGVVVLVAVLWCLGDRSPVGHFASAQDKTRFMAAYDRAMTALPPPQQVRDIRTGYGIVLLRGVEVAAAAAVLLLGIVLLLGYLASERLVMVCS